MISEGAKRPLPPPLDKTLIDGANYFVHSENYIHPVEPKDEREKGILKYRYGLFGRDNIDGMTVRDNKHGLVVQKVGKIKIKREKAQNAKKGEIFRKLKRH